MKRVVSGITAVCLTMGALGAAISSADAAPIPFMKPEAAGATVQLAQFRRDGDRNRVERPRLNPPRQERRVEHPRFERRGNWGYYNGHRGSREYRRGYRHYNGWWFPPAAFVAGALIGGAIAQPPVVVAPPVYAPARLSAAHVNWCTNRWKSYRVSDNSYQPLNGPRQACVSPYGG